MAITPILALPTELLDKIYCYLDWDTSYSLAPSRPDIRNLSLTCRHLRETTLPLIFRNVTLRLRWVDGALVEPSLFRIRRDYPHLANYVRSVYVETQFGQLRGSYWNLKDFAVPGHLSSWLQPSDSSGVHNQEIQSSHRDRLQSIARTFFQRYNYPEVPEYCSSQLRDDMTFARTIQEQLLSGSDRNSNETSRIGEEADWVERREAVDRLSSQVMTKEQRKAQRDARLELDALVVVLLCLPSCVNSLAFETVHNHRSDTLQNVFSLHVAATAIRIFGHRLRRLTMITSPERLSHRPTHDHRDFDLHLERSIITEEVLNNVMHVDTLVLSDYHGNGNPRYREINADSQVHWNILTDILNHLELWNMQSDSTGLLPLITGFANLQTLTLKNIVLGAPPHFQPQPQRQADELFWLSFLIELRRQMPYLDLRFGELKSWGDRLRMVVLPESALQWLKREAIPEGCAVGFDRETRLTEDFESFLPLWYAEDGENGKLAKAARRDGRLVDEAMASRWKTFANLR